MAVVMGGLVNFLCSYLFIDGEIFICIYIELIYIIKCLFTLLLLKTHGFLKNHSNQWNSYHSCQLIWILLVLGMCRPASTH